jgi:RNA polymerase sigma-70 factor (ECF subfamily)
MEDEKVSYIEPVDNDSMEELLINQQEVQQLISELTDEENELLYLWAVEEHTVEEIATIYQKPKGTVLSKLHRLKKRIRKQLDNVNIFDTRVGR